MSKKNKLPKRKRREKVKLLKHQQKEKEYLKLRNNISAALQNLGPEKVKEILNENPPNSNQQRKELVRLKREFPSLE